MKKNGKCEAIDLEFIKVDFIKTRIVMQKIYRQWNL